jgi:hypothetical protein
LEETIGKLLLIKIGRQNIHIGTVEWTIKISHGFNIAHLNPIGPNMKTKLLLFTTLFLLHETILFSQCISIELSLTWEMHNDIFNKDSVMNTPVLNISYYNHCTENYYFLKLSSKDAEKHATTGRLAPFYTDNDYRKRAQKNLNYYINYNFDVIIGGKPWYDKSWSISCTKEDYQKAFGETVQFGLHEIYDYMYRENYLIRKKEKPRPAYFVPSDITPENILLDSIIKDQFVFLKPREIQTDTYNLIAYKLVGGCFTFLIEQEEIKNYVVDQFSVFLEEIEIELPEIVGEYQRYSGAFNTNKVTVCFGGRE